MLVSAEGVGISKGSLYSPQPLACMQGEIHNIYAWIYAYCKAEMTVLSWVICVVVVVVVLFLSGYICGFKCTDKYRFLFMCERWYYLVMSFFLLGKNVSVSTEIHPKPMSSTQGINSLIALVISRKGIRPSSLPHPPQKHPHTIAGLQCIRTF